MAAVFCLHRRGGPSLSDKVPWNLLFRTEEDSKSMEIVLEQSVYTVSDKIPSEAFYFKQEV
jgi:hypothetical protein